MNELKPFEQTEASLQSGRIRIKLSGRITPEHTLALAKGFQAAAYKMFTGQDLSEILGEKPQKQETIDVDFKEESPKLIE